MNNSMRIAFQNSNITPKMFRKSRQIVGPDMSTKPLVIQTNARTRLIGGRVHLTDSRVHVQNVRHIVGIGVNKKAVTEGGDMWRFRDDGNGFLRAIRG